MATNLFDFLDQHKLKLEIAELDRKERYLVRLARCEFKYDAGCEILHFLAGEGDSPTTAIECLVRKIADQRLIYDAACPDTRREFQVPRDLFYQGRPDPKEIAMSDPFDFTSSLGTKSPLHQDRPATKEPPPPAPLAPTASSSIQSDEEWIDSFLEKNTGDRVALTLAFQAGWRNGLEAMARSFEMANIPPTTRTMLARACRMMGGADFKTGSPGSGKPQP